MKHTQSNKEPIILFLLICLMFFGAFCTMLMNVQIRVAHMRNHYLKKNIKTHDSTCELYSFDHLFGGEEFQVLFADEETGIMLIKHDGHYYVTRIRVEVDMFEISPDDTQKACPTVSLPSGWPI